LNICLLSRYFDTNHTEGVGIGRISGELYKQLVKRDDYIFPIASRPGGLLTYLIYTALLIPLELRVQKFDVYHALTPMESFWIPKKRSIVTINDLFSLINVKGMGSGLQGSKTLMKLAQFYYLKACESAVRCKKLVCISEKTKEDIIRILNINPEKIKVIRPGISNTLEPIARQHKEFTIGYIGALDNRKRVNLLIEAFKKSNIEGRLLIGGQGLEELKLRELASGSSTIFMGYIPEDKINNFYSLLDLLIFPTSM
jgi:glycosyltransferase involved in cell wall biosynthesis